MGYIWSKGKTKFFAHSAYDVPINVNARKADARKYSKRLKMLPRNKTKGFFIFKVLPKKR